MCHFERMVCVVWVRCAWAVGSVWGGFKRVGKVLRAALSCLCACVCFCVCVCVRGAVSGMSGGAQMPRSHGLNNGTLRCEVRRTVTVTQKFQHGHREMTMLVLASSERMKMVDADQKDVATVTQKNEKRPKMWQSMTLAC